MTFEQKWLENDFNPFIVFNQNGKIETLNTEAQFLLGIVSSQELFELASSYANITFGFKTTFLDLEFGRYKFFGLTVGYEDEENIGLKLYQSPSFKIKKEIPNGELTNIYTLIDLCITTNSINSSINYTKELDPTLPEVVIDSNSFVKLLNKIYKYYAQSTKIKTKVYLRTGEYIKFDDKKYSLFCVEVVGERSDSTMIEPLMSYINKSSFYADIKDSITINIPMITA
jgi:hypothetical protein